MSRPMSDGNRRKVKAMAERGDDPYAIAAAIGCSAMTVRRVLGTQPTEKRKRAWGTVRELLK